MSDDRWSSNIDQILGDLFKDTDVTRLPGSGKPLDLSHNPFEPADMRVANRLLKENDLAPDWIIEGRELDSLYETLKMRISSFIAQNPREKRSVLEADVKAYNKRVLTYNLKVPAGFSHKRTINLEKALGG